MTGNLIDCAPHFVDFTKLCLYTLTSICIVTKVRNTIFLKGRGLILSLLRRAITQQESTCYLCVRYQVQYMGRHLQVGQGKISV